MSIEALNQVITTARADGMITLEEARNITGPKGAGDFVNTFERKAVADLVTNIKSGSVQAEPRAAYHLEKLATAEPKSRGQHIFETIFGLKLGSMLGAVPGLAAGGAAGMFVFVSFAAQPLGPALAILAMLGLTVLGGLAGASAGGAIQGALDD